MRPLKPDIEHIRYRYGERELACQVKAALIPPMRGQLDDARSALLRILPLCRQLGYTLGTIRCAHNLAEVCLVSNELEAVTSAHSVNDRVLPAIAHC